MKLHQNLHRAETGISVSRCFYQWWAVEVSNLRPQQCECQFKACRDGAPEGRRRGRRAETGSREQLFAPDLHRPEYRPNRPMRQSRNHGRKAVNPYSNIGQILAALPSGVQRAIPTNGASFI